MAIHKDTYGDRLEVSATPGSEEPRIYVTPEPFEDYIDWAFSVEEAQALVDDILQQIELVTGE